MEHFYSSIGGWSGGIIETYAYAVNTFPTNSHFVEVGTWKGRSAAFMAVEILNSGKDIKFDCVDPWSGAGGYEDDCVINGNLYEHFIDNMKPVEGKYTAIRKTSLDAVQEYDNDTLDFVFLDAAHDYENVLKDIHAWYKKVKPGGVLAGHDYVYGDVRKAVDECFADNLTTVARVCWWKQKDV